MHKSRYKALLLCALMPLCLTGCGFIDAIVGFFKMVLVIVALAIQVVFVVTQGVGLLSGSIRSKRGTNVATRFVRNSMQSLKVAKISGIGVVVTLASMGIGYIGGGVFGLFCGLPSLILVAIALMSLKKDNKDPQRIKDARVMTKASLDVASQTATTVGTVAGTVIGGIGTGSAVGKAVGDGVSVVAANASANMQVEGAVNIDVRAVNDSIMEVSRIANPQLFISQAAKVGIPTERRSLHEIAEEVVRYAPAQRLQNIDTSQPVEDIAMDILNSYYIDKVKQEV